MVDGAGHHPDTVRYSALTPAVITHIGMALGGLVGLMTAGQMAAAYDQPPHASAVYACMEPGSRCPSQMKALLNPRRNAAAGVGADRGQPTRVPRTSPAELLDSLSHTAQTLANAPQPGLSWEKRRTLVVWFWGLVFIALTQDQVQSEPAEELLEELNNAAPAAMAVIAAAAYPWHMAAGIDDYGNENDEPVQSRLSVCALTLARLPSAMGVRQGSRPGPAPASHAARGRLTSLATRPGRRRAVRGRRESRDRTVPIDGRRL
ncbi:hypothetical protein ACFVY1_41445 [Streptomyces sp. NPDC058293]|uniref:hypothetical protein n=1 Tax=Streptomyces sp. NPDC058293 TaxID=3346429 RepID=UPI0036E874C9